LRSGNDARRDIVRAAGDSGGDGGLSNAIALDSKCDAVVGSAMVTPAPAARPVIVIVMPPMMLAPLIIIVMPPVMLAPRMVHVSRRVPIILVVAMAVPRLGIGVRRVSIIVAVAVSVSTSVVPTFVVATLQRKNTEDEQ